ncbi:MAG: TetR family transcriptional regulator [Spirochaetales bacterium]|nr:MAG: TetR family transcriptional regulator [Spirochaetales bacterium]
MSAEKPEKVAVRAKSQAQRNNKDIINLRRTQLTAAAYRVVSRKGYYNFTIKDIAREAGLSTGLVHYYFKDKQELLFTLLKEMNNNLRVFLNRALAKSDDPREKLSIFLDQAFNLVEREKDYFHVLIDFWTQINHNERIRRANVKLFESFRIEVGAIITEGMREGIFRKVDVAYIAMVIVSIIQGAIIQYVLDRAAFNYKEYTGRIKVQVMEMMLKKAR